MSQSATKHEDRLSLFRMNEFGGYNGKYIMYIYNIFLLIINYL
jgi:hypothetical protein